MFRRQPNIITVNAPTQTEYVVREVHEHRAPTDDSARLLREMEASAEAKVIKSVRVENCPIDCVIQVMEDAMNDDRIARAVMKINGATIVAEARAGLRDQGQGELLQRLKDDAAQKIATKLVFDALGTMER
jgi:hypothetical protein